MGNQQMCCCSGDSGKKVTAIALDNTKDREGPLTSGAASSAEVYNAAEAMEPDPPAVYDGEPPEPPPKRERSKPKPAKAAPDGGARAAPPETAPSLCEDQEDLTITMRRNVEDNIGLNLDALDGTSAFVDDIIPGAVKAWNDSHPGGNNLKINDRITAVNGVGGDTEQILAELKQSTTWSLTVLRPALVRVTVNCERTPSLGLDLKYSPNGRTLLISEVGEGAIREWNAESQGTRVTPGDRIVEINGQSGSARRLLESAANVDKLDLGILHYA